MAKIITFPVKHSNGYLNIMNLIQIAERPVHVSQYLEIADKMEQDGKLLDGEYQEILEFGRKTRIERASAHRTKREVNGAGAYMYTPEMGQEKPDCQIEAQRSHWNGHMLIWTNLELKGRGIQTNGTATRNGKVVNEYYVTDRAYNKLKESYSISLESNLD